MKRTCKGFELIKYKLPNHYLSFSQTLSSRQECPSIHLAQAYLSTEPCFCLVNQLRFDVLTTIKLKHQ
uniref:Uncharacterized protein n=1 Tax=Helianthus annuus TaxID=4232 RepID=A0A251SWM4_HELAN